MEDRRFGREKDSHQNAGSDMPEKLWFIDKQTGEKAVVTAEKAGNGKLSFFYKGKRYTFSADLLGKRIFACSSETLKKERCQPKKLFYRGECFQLENGRWISNNGDIPKDQYQERLSKLYRKRCKHYGHSTKELIEFAKNQMKDVDGINTSIRSLEIAIVQATADEAKEFLATLCSLYRQKGLSAAAVSLYDYAMGEYGWRVETVPFLTSVSAALMDVGNIDGAERLKKKAFSKGGRSDAMLKAFLKRFDAETRIE